MNPREVGVETSAWYIGIHVTKIPIPNPAIIRAAMNMPTLTEPAQRPAPMLRMIAPIWMVCFRDRASADQEL